MVLGRFYCYLIFLIIWCVLYTTHSMFTYIRQIVTLPLKVIEM